MFRNSDIQNKIFTPARLLGIALGLFIAGMICGIVHQSYRNYKANKGCTEDKRAGNFIELTGTPLFISALTSSLTQER